MHHCKYSGRAHIDNDVAYVCLYKCLCSAKYMENTSSDVTRSSQRFTCLSLSLFFSLLFFPSFFHSFLWVFSIFFLFFVRSLFPLSLASANNAKINFREKEKKVLDQILGQGKYDARIRPSGINGTGKCAPSPPQCGLPNRKKPKTFFSTALRISFTHFL